MKTIGWQSSLILIIAFGWLFSPLHAAEEVIPMYGSTVIDGYDFRAGQKSKDIGPKGSMRYNASKNHFKGSYTGLKMPKGRKAIFAWLHDTVNQKTEYLGPVGWLKNTTGGKNKGRFTIPVPAKYKGGNFGSYEIVAFTSESTNYINGSKVVTTPKAPSGSKIQKAQNPAFYLFAALPGADTDLHYCGHGQDFFYAKAPSKQTCYD